MRHGGIRAEEELQAHLESILQRLTQQITILARIKSRVLTEIIWILSVAENKSSWSMAILFSPLILFIHLFFDPTNPVRLRDS